MTERSNSDPSQLISHNHRGQYVNRDMDVDLNDRAHRLTNHNRFLNKKCWICLATLEFDNEDRIRIQKFFNDQNSLFLLKKPPTYSNFDDNQNSIKLRLFKDKYVLSACKCRKKLAHKTCFNNYIDLKQNGNVKVDIFCSQCNYKYEFHYEYNNFFLKFMDFIEITLNNGSYILTGVMIGITAYWCCLSYSAATMIQIFGYQQSLEIFNNSSIGYKILLGLLMPFMPLGLVSARYINWEKYFLRLLPNYSDSYLPTQRKSTTNETNVESESNNSFKRMSSIRLAVGALFLPTIATTIDKYMLKPFFLDNFTLLRTCLAGFAFVSLKGLAKIVYYRKKKWQKLNREIQNSKF